MAMGPFSPTWLDSATPMRGKDYDLLDLELVQARLAQPPDQQTTHPETGTRRALFDFPDLSLSPAGPRTRVIVAAREAPESPAKVGTTRGESCLQESKYEPKVTNIPAQFPLTLPKC